MWNYIKKHKSGLTTVRVRAPTALMWLSYEVLHAYYKRESIPCDYLGRISTWCITRSSDTAHYLYPTGLTMYVTPVHRCHITPHSKPVYRTKYCRSVLLMQSYKYTHLYWTHTYCNTPYTTLNGPNYKTGLGTYYPVVRRFLTWGSSDPLEVHRYI